jgi:hypothetical protein
MCHQPSLRSEVCIHVSSAKRARCTPGLGGGGASFIYVLYRVGDRTETRGTPACISLGADISPSTQALNFLFELVSLVKLGSAHSSGLSCLSGMIGRKESLYLAAELGTPVYYSAAHFEELKIYLMLSGSKSLGPVRLLF